MNTSDNTGIGKSGSNSRTRTSNTSNSTNNRYNKQRGPLPASNQHSNNQSQNRQDTGTGTKDIDNFEIRSSENEGSDNMEALSTISTQLPVGAILARLRARKEQETNINSSTSENKPRMGGGKGKSQGQQTTGQINLILGAEEEALLPPGERIRLRRLHQKLTQTELATAAHISQMSISLIENGVRDSGPEVLIKLAYLLGIDPPTDIYKYYEVAIKNAEKEVAPDKEAVAPAPVPAPEFLFLPKELTAEDKKTLNNMAANLLKVRMAERGIMADRSNAEILASYRAGQDEQNRKTQENAQPKTNTNKNHLKGMSADSDSNTNNSNSGNKTTRKGVPHLSTEYN